MDGGNGCARPGTCTVERKQIIVVIRVEVSHVAGVQYYAHLEVAKCVTLM